VLCTSGNDAHISGAVELGLGMCAPILLNPADHNLWTKINGDRRYWSLDVVSRVAIGRDVIRAIHVPSLTEGSVVLHLTGHNSLFTGDALVRDFAGLDSSLSPELSVDARVHPGHGDSYGLDEVLSSSTIRLVPQNA